MAAGSWHLAKEVSVNRLVLLRTAGAVAAALIVGTVLVGNQTPAAAYGGQRNFNVGAALQGVTGAQFQGTLQWSESNQLTTQVRIFNATISDTAPDDARAVARIHYEYVPFKYDCPVPEMGCNVIELPRVVKDMVYVADATPNNITNAANVTLPEIFGRYENVWVRACLEQWRYDPDLILTCSPWR
jgi:hypothetical protein